MRRLVSILSVLSAIAVASTFAQGCSCDGELDDLGGSAGSTSNADGGAGATSSGGAGQGGTGGGEFVDHGEITSLAIDPPNAEVIVTDGVSDTVTFVAMATYEDGFSGPVEATWSFDRLELGLVDEDGSFTAGGSLGGHGMVTAQVGSASATAGVDVRLRITDNVAGLTPQQIDQFSNPDANPSGTLLYPYDQTMFARDIPAPEIMWSGGSDGDLYFVRFTEGYVETSIYVAAPPPSAFLMTDVQWNQLTKSNAGEPVQVSVQRLSSDGAHQPMTETWNVAQGSLRGTIYYWAVNTGQSMKIAPGDTAPSVVFDSGPYDQLGSPAPPNYDGSVPPWTPGTNAKRCVACHTVSKRGERLVGVFENGGSAPSPWGTVDLTQNPSPVLQVSSYTEQVLFLALSPDGAFAIRNDVDFTLHLADASTGVPIATALDGLTAVADPSFSEDGRTVAFASNVVGAYPVEYWQGDLDLMDFDPATTTFSNRRTLVTAGASAIAFPSFSPDGKWVFYQRGDYSRAKYGSSSVGHNDLYMAAVDGSVGETPLGRANGEGILDASSLHVNYQPNANPVASGGYYWIVFFSPRDYGNKMASSGNPTYDNRKQLWVAAVDLDAQAGTDPSHPPFYLRGQDLTTINMKGYWALDPCKAEGSGCDAGFECCEGSCVPDDEGNLVCGPPPSGCVQEGNSCETAADCCNGLTCIGGFCALDSPG